eukprot:4804574-Alexandrium_andersonii.AAC.1
MAPPFLAGLTVTGWARPLGQQHSDNSALSRFKRLLGRFKRFVAAPLRGEGLPPPGKRRKAPLAPCARGAFRG